MRSVCHCVQFQPKLDFSKNPSGGSLVFLLAHRDGRTDGHVSYLETKRHSGNHVRCLPHLYRQQNKRLKFVTARGSADVQQQFLCMTSHGDDTPFRLSSQHSIFMATKSQACVCVQLRMNTHAHRTELVDRADTTGRS
jgi:hypothetical protein